MRKSIHFMTRMPYLFFLLFLLTSISALPALGQGNTEQKIWASYWTVEPGYTSVLQMKNNRIRDTLSVQVSIYFSGGEEYPLEPITVGPRQTIVLDLNNVISSLPPSIRSRATREGSLEVEYSATNASALMGSVSVTNRQQGTAWNFFMYPVFSDLPVAPVRGAFWLYDEHTDGFVIAHNASELPMTVTPRFEIASMSFRLAPVQLGPGEALKLELGKELRRLGLRDVHAGGLEFTYEGAPDALKAHGVLFNGKGFSAEIDFNRFDSWPEETEFFFRTPRFAVGSPDPGLGLPAGSVFEPYVVLHNFNRHNLSATLAVGFRVGESQQELTVPVALSPGDTQVLDLHRILKDRLPPEVSWGSLELSYKDWHNGLAMTMVSLSEDGKYSIRSVLNWVEASWREGWYWRADQEFNTLLGIYNSDAEDASVVVSLDYYVDGVRRSYELPNFTISRRSSQLIDIGEMLSRGVPDADGDVVPPSIFFGGYSVHRTGPRQFENITTEALIFSRESREFLTIYNTGCCHEPANFYPAVDSGIPGNYGWLFIDTINMCTGEYIDLVLLAQEHPESDVIVSFFSNDYSVADVLDPVAGYYRLMAPGTTTLTSSLWYYPMRSLHCRRTHAYGYCEVTVKPQITNITPAKGLIAASTSVTINGWGFESGVTVQAGTGITVNITSFTDTQIQANFVIASNAPSGDHAVTLTAAGQTSNSLNFFVQVPTVLTVVSVNVLATGTSGDFGCVPGYDYGIMVDIKYQVKDQSGSPLQSASMVPHESGTFHDGQAFDNNVGPTYISTTSQTTASDGTFHDAPVGSCSFAPFSGRTLTQNITIRLNGASYPGGPSYSVRSNVFTVSSTTLPGHGSITNGGDIIGSR